MSTVRDTSQEADSAIQGWLKDIPDKQIQRHSLLSGQLFDIQNLDKTSNSSEAGINSHRPSSILSISSEDSVNLNDLINANYGTDMDEELELPNFALLDLVDDSSEEFWKLDNIPNYLTSVPRNQGSNVSTYENRNEFVIPPVAENATIYKTTESVTLMSKQKREHDFTKAINYSIADTYETKLNELYYSVPYGSPLAVADSAQHRNDRSGSFSSENSLTSQSTSTTTVRSNNSWQPTASTSTSTIKASSPRFRGSVLTTRPSTSTTTGHTQKGRPQRKFSKIPSISEHSTVKSNTTTTSGPTMPRFLYPSQSTLPKRATHIPSSSSSVTTRVVDNKSSSALISLSSKSSSLQLATKKPNNSNNTLLTRFANINQKDNTTILTPAGPSKKRESHIPTLPTRSTTSLDMSPSSSIFSLNSSPYRQHQTLTAHYSSNTRPQTALDSRHPVAATNKFKIRSTSMLKMPSASKSTGLGLKKPASSRNYYS
ncbi:hypothetical protein BDF20DRAFT_839420 [Mycotypha africana]|uniref:uncharacterized protein n=1 Tax=Mycotypha africana TaxID=64632 RepID=UPI00230192AC|nr:uncharacterized protein BDF20DRAFT_839420 [Mycotypha africana]KAI8968298.1 hypothetical protein BDF20DRAFT_839420 [Mycotypha africana]